MPTRFAILLAGATLASATLVSACVQDGGGATVDDLQGTAWHIAEIAGKDTLPNSTVTLSFEADGRAGGKGSCNSYGAGYQVAGSRITFEQPFSTMMACAPELMEQERALFDLLPQIERFAVGDDGALVLTTKDGRTIVARR